MKIVHIITRFIRGGADENTLFSCNGQAEAGHTVYLMIGREFNSDILMRLDDRVKVVIVDSLIRKISPINDMLSVKKIRSHLIKINPDIVHTHTSKAGVVGRVAAKLCNVPVVIHGVHILPFLNVTRTQRFIYWSLEKMLAPVTDFYVDVSAGMKDESIRAGIGTYKNHIVIPSGMDVSSFITADKIRDDEHLDLLPKAIERWSSGNIILMVAAFEARKRQSEFLDEFVNIVTKDPRSVLLLAGAGEDEELLRRKVISLGLKDNVGFIGFRSDIARWIKLSKLCVLSSCREGLPRVIVQYALCGKPIVATKLPGLDAVIDNGQSGFIVAEVDQMTAPIMKLMHDDVLYDKFCREVDKRSFEDWSVNKMNSMLLGLYAQLHSGRDAA